MLSENYQTIDLLEMLDERDVHLNIAESNINDPSSVKSIITNNDVVLNNTGKYIRKLDISWDYKGEFTKSYTHCFHNYPAMFIPQVARRLLKTYSKIDDTVCDIFCGSGTSLVEGKLLGRNAYGIDLNPLAILLAKVKTTLINPSLLAKKYFALLSNINRINIDDIELPKFNNLDFWFNKDVIINLSIIKKAIHQIEDIDIRNFFLVSFSETVRLSSNTKSSEFKLVRINKEKLQKHSPDVLAIFKKRTETNIKGMEDFHKDADRNVWTKIIYGNSSENNGIKTDSIDCIITSPPYGDSRTTVAYGQFSRLSTQWIGLLDDPNKASGVDKNLLGGKPIKTFEHSLQSSCLDNTLKLIQERDEKRAKEVLSFYLELNNCLKQAYKILKPKKFFCLVVGNRMVKQIRIPTDFIIAELGEKIGFKCIDIFVRNIPGKRMPFKNSPTNIVGVMEETMNKESIVILQKK